MRHVKLTDDELWRAIAQNTEEMSALVHQLDTDVLTGIFSPSCAQSRSYLEAVDKFEREYREYTAELRRRYLSPKKKRFATIRRAWSWASSLTLESQLLLGWRRKRKAQAVA